LADPFWQVRLKAVRSLGRLRNARAVAPVAACLSHEQANLRKEAAAALGEIADPSAERFLDAVRDDPDPDVRKNVRWALQQISAKRAVS
jgi:vesicle coat complex subunit